jgi:hypothetical protein
MIAIAKHFQIFKQARSHLLPQIAIAPHHEFGLDRMEEALDSSFVPAVRMQYAGRRTISAAILIQPKMNAHRTKTTLTSIRNITGA